MSLTGLTVVSSYGAQSLCSAAIGVLLFHFYTRYRKGYLLQWSNGWFALFLFHAGTALDLYLSRVVQPMHPVRLVCIAIASISLFLFVLWFLGGCYELAKQRPLRGDTWRRAVIAALVLGVAYSVVVAVSSSVAFHYTAAVTFPSIVAGGALLLGAVTLLGRRRPGFTVFLSVAVAAAAARFATAVLGFLWLGGTIVNRYPGLFGVADIVILCCLGLAQIISLLEDEREAAMLAASEIEHLAYHDGLTGLPNRALFFDRLTIALAHARRYGTQLAIFFVDLDRFKNINDSLGHSTGDTLLRLAAARIRESVRQDDTVARFGGDEFTIIIHNFSSVDHLVRVSQKVLEKMREPFLIGSRELVVTASIGVSVFPDDGTDADTLVKNSDTAMYGAKEQGRDRFQLYAQEMNARVLERLELENALRKAMQEDQLVLHYQPLFDIQLGGVFGVEALIRWNHPSLGMLSPLNFIPAAEASGLIVPIGGWVMREACLQARKWQIEKGLFLVMSVNLSARQFQHPALLEEIMSALEAAELDPKYLEVEITESIAVQNVEVTSHVLRQLKKLGIRVAIDDFGTGYSSLSYLKQFPIDTIKLDQSFVRDITSPQDAAIAMSVIAMAHSLNMKVMAEGVETEIQLAFLKKENCDRLQGFFYSVPLAPLEFDEFVSSNSWLFAGAGEQ